MKPHGAARACRWALYLAAAAVASYALFACWWQYSLRAWPLAARFEGPAGVYTLAAPPRVARTEAGGAALEGELYLVGGIGAFAQTFTSVERYDPRKDAWERLPDLPQPINHPGVVAAAGRLWVVGGFRPLGLRPRGAMIARWDPLDTVYAFDPASGRWSEGPRLPEPRGAGGVAATADAIWYVGGIDESRGLADELFRLDLARGVWERAPSMPTARDHLRLEAVGERLFAISGRRDDLRFNLPVVERYDVAGGVWTRVADVPFARGGLGSAVVDGRIYTFGGELLWTTSAAVERYDPAADRWESLGPMPEARHGICAGVLDGRLHLVAGGRHPRVSISGIHRVLDLR